MPVLASPAIVVAGHHRHGHRQEQRQHDEHGRQRHEHAVVGDVVEQRPAVAAAVAPAGRRQLDRDRDHHRDQPEHRQDRDVAPPPEDHGELRAQEPSGSWPRSRDFLGVSPCWGPRPTQPETSKPSPVSRTKTSSRRARSTAKPRTPTPAATSAATTRSGCGVAEHRTHGAVARVDLGEAQSAQHLARRRAAIGGADPHAHPLLRAAVRPACPARPAARRSSPRRAVHTCSTSLSRWEDTSTVTPSARQRRRSGGAPRGCPAGRGRSSARQAPAASRGCSRAAAMPSRCRMPSE